VTGAFDKIASYRRHKKRQRYARYDYFYTWSNIKSNHKSRRIIGVWWMRTTKFQPMCSGRSCIECDSGHSSFSWYGCGRMAPLHVSVADQVRLSTSSHSRSSSIIINNINDRGERAVRRAQFTRTLAIFAAASRCRTVNFVLGAGRVALRRPDAV